MQVIGIAGEPGTGKSTVVRQVLKMLGKGRPFKDGLVFGTWYRTENLFVLGDYSDPHDKTPGTDRMSMALQPALLKWLNAKRATASRVLLEGDRVMNLSFIRAVNKLMPIQVWALQAPPEMRAARLKTRGKPQSEAFLKGRASKVRKLIVSGYALPKHNIDTRDSESFASQLAHLVSSQMRPNDDLWFDLLRWRVSNAALAATNLTAVALADALDARLKQEGILKGDQ